MTKGIRWYTTLVPGSGIHGVEQAILGAGSCLSVPEQLISRAEYGLTRVEQAISADGITIYS